MSHDHRLIMNTKSDMHIDHYNVTAVTPYSFSTSHPVTPIHSFHIPSHLPLAFTTHLDLIHKITISVPIKVSQSVYDQGAFQDY
jgi:hypothetical protein